MAPLVLSECEWSLLACVGLETDDGGGGGGGGKRNLGRTSLDGDGEEYMPREGHWLPAAGTVFPFCSWWSSTIDLRLWLSRPPVTGGAGGFLENGKEGGRGGGGGGGGCLDIVSAGLVG